ncbi:unnamed protein product [Adineta ricciae]|uniref:G-protein coupled receptors family 1 profile domain-containing protein n=1 Tax=Adineta ricciae TaxID=249248 RepID=A0A815PKW9_ADIRI|nr:unnamed protein product [Adineta ricciae]CAF1450663.1 unnamed protein product [Adineta ricciae]
MRKNPFSIYLIAFNISNLCYIWLSLFPLFFNQILNINPTTYNLSYCRFYYYLSYILNMLCPSFLILASIDRVLISSPNALTRQKSTRRLAFILLILVTFLWFIYYCQYLFRINMNILVGPIPICYFDLGDYSLYVNYSAIVLGLIPPILLSICALKTFQNLHRDRFLEGNENQNRQITQNNRQLIRMLFVEILIDVVCTIIQPIVLSYLFTTIYVVKSSQQRNIESFILNVSNFLSYVPNCTSFYCNISCSKKFRKRLMTTFRKTNEVRTLQEN